jgi:uncharacterized protein (TIGR03083 family)
VNRHSAVSSLLAAWTVNACGPAEADAVDAHLTGCPTCQADLSALSRAAELFGGNGFPPPKSLRTRVIAAVDRPRLPPHGAAYAATVAALDALLRELPPDDWTLAAHAGWTVLDLVIHLTATDNLVADQLGLHVHPPVSADDTPDSRTKLLLSMPRHRDRAWHGWRHQATTICSALATRSVTPDLMVSRAFETWIHARDIAHATDRNLPIPPSTHLHTIADLTARLLPHAATSRRIAAASARLILTGPGGGTWTLTLSDPDLESTVELTMDVTEFCLLVAARREPRAVDVMIRGDVELGYDLLDAAPTLALK